MVSVQGLRLANLAWRVQATKVTIVPACQVEGERSTSKSHHGHRKWQSGTAIPQYSTSKPTYAWPCDKVAIIGWQYLCLWAPVMLALPAPPLLLTTVLACQVEAERGALAVHIEYIEDGSLGEPILSIQDAIRAKSYLSPPVELTTNIGDAAKALSEAQHTITNAR